MKTAQELLSGPVSVWSDGLGLRLNFCCFVGVIPVAVLLQTLLICREGIEFWVGVFSFLFLSGDHPVFLNLQVLLPSKGNFTALLTLCGPCSTIHGLC